MPRPNDSPDVSASKTLAYILRHGAEKEQLDIRSDGYIKLADVLARPKMRGVDLEMVLRLVAENAKQRFEVFYGYDPSAPKPKVKGKGKGAGKGKGKGKKQDKSDGQTIEGASSSMEAVQLDTACVHTPTTTTRIEQDDREKLDDLESSLSSTTISNTALDAPPPPHPVITAELPLIPLPVPTDPSDPSLPPDQKGEYFIRASQGHSLKLESVSHLTPVLLDDDGRARAGEMVHGTRWELWETLKSQGLSKMARQHIHLAPTLDPSKHRITPRPTSTLYIYLDLDRLVNAGIPVYTSTNGVVLTPGDESGKVPKEFWRLVEHKVRRHVTDHEKHKLEGNGKGEGKDEQEGKDGKNGKDGKDGKEGKDIKDDDVVERVVIWRDGKDVDENRE
ncbi:KptA family-domain-containing protein [Naematelia encephala]|uniref:2'-phosphotransferase n=1 Tax=Naematelia encephala TaxID=71784 RepID=A0A1Y2BJT1_9TREE|nr:KptA family-domain-containing protein [Naematelia encephala]